MTSPSCDADIIYSSLFRTVRHSPSKRDCPGCQNTIWHICDCVVCVCYCGVCCHYTIVTIKIFELLQLAGWDETQHGTSSNVLLYVELPYVDYHNCVSQVPSVFYHYITSDKFCAGKMYNVFENYFILKY